MPSSSENIVEGGGMMRENGEKKRRKGRKDRGKERRKVEHPHPSTDGQQNGAYPFHGLLFRHN